MSKEDGPEEVAEEIPTEDEVVEPTIEEKLAEAIERAEKAEAEIGYRDADLINLRKRHSMERSEAMKFAGFNLSSRILPVLDGLDRALLGAEDGAFKEGIQMIRENMVEALSAEGISCIEVEGLFDPKIMEAITTMPASENHPEGTVIDILETGWMYKDRVLRPARVVVAKE
ncbi:MAG: nucleotide exchange factor GrpE [Candidatus Thalassarchaeaceae archaeon]|jgi:molecular chaperone GrpE|nr:nucleotide exchange factor GrpE [Candidatus Thalassarchaeaceae archaeon]